MSRNDTPNLEHQQQGERDERNEQDAQATEARGRGRAGVGDRAPDFTLRTQTGAEYHLAEHLGARAIVLYFYPKDDTPGCTSEACAFRDAAAEYAKEGVAVVGISKDTVGSHKRFAEKFSLPFPLLADRSTEVIQAYGAWGPKKFMGRTFDGILRKTYLVTPDGEIAKAYEGMDVLVHADEVLEDVRRLRAA